MWAVWRVGRTKLILMMALVVLATAAGAISRVQAPLVPIDPGPLHGRVIAIDPGHGGKDGGCGHDGHLEKDLTLDLAKRLAPLIRSAGAAAVLTRAQDVELSRLYPDEKTRQRRDLMARVQKAQMHQVDLVVSLHLNAGRPNMKGSMVFYQSSLPFSYAAATQVQSRLSEPMPGNQNAVLPARFFILRRLEALEIPAILIELGFLSNAEDRRKLLDAKTRDKLAEAIRDGIVNAIIENRENTVAPSLIPLEWLGESAESFSGGECPEVIVEDAHA